MEVMRRSICRQRHELQRISLSCFRAFLALSTAASHLLPSHRPFVPDSQSSSDEKSIFPTHFRNGERSERHFLVAHGYQTPTISSKIDIFGGEHKLVHQALKTHTPLDDVRHGQSPLYCATNK